MKKALLIGIDYIDVSGISLKGCINDVINMRNMLIDAYDYEPQNIIMLRDDDAAKFKSPTNDNIVFSIIELVLESANLEEIWLHYSGHGSQIQKQNCDSEKAKELLSYVALRKVGLNPLHPSSTDLAPGRRSQTVALSTSAVKSWDLAPGRRSQTVAPGAIVRRSTVALYNDKNCTNRDNMQILIPVDYRTNGCIVDRDLYDMVRRCKCRAILTFDCCHSGTVCDLQWTTDYQVQPVLKDEADSDQLSGVQRRKVKDINDIIHSAKLGMLVTTKISDATIKNPNIVMFSGCRDDQTSLDTINDMDQRSGAFTNALCECLRASHHNTSILSLYKDICIYLLERGYDQIPVLSSTVETPTHIITKNQMNEG